ncbi:MAG: S1 RNA-binding domain-containing protein, partial [bacterium]
MAKKHKKSAAPAVVEDTERAQMSRMYEETLKTFTEGSIIPGKVLEVRGDGVLVDIGYKSEGMIHVSEFPDISAVKPGDVFNVLLEGIEDEEGLVMLSKSRAEQQERWNEVLETHKEGSIVNGDVRSRVKGGFIVDVGGVESFLPGSQVDVSPVHDPDAMVGKTLEFKIIKIHDDRRNIVLSRRELMEDRRRDRKRELLTEIKVGQVRKGSVKNITDFGVFVDLDGMDGLLHITDMSWGRINHPTELVKVGEELEVVILDVNME